MRVDLFDFELPQERIALEPASPRDAARLLYVGRESIDDHSVRDLATLLRPGDLLVTNDTKVIPAQLFGHRESRTGGEPVSIEATLHKDLGGDCWRAFVRPAKRLKEGDIVTFASGLSASVMHRDGAEADLQFDVGGSDFFAALESAGVMPLPPTLRANGRQMKQTPAAIKPCLRTSPVQSRRRPQGCTLRRA